MEEWEACSVQVGDLDVPACPVGQPCNHAWHVGKFITWPVPGRTECHCKYDGGTHGYPCHGDKPCYCAKLKQVITVAPVEEINLPGMMVAGNQEYLLSGSDGCPCPEDPDWKDMPSVMKATSHADAF